MRKKVCVSVNHTVVPSASVTAVPLSEVFLPLAWVEMDRAWDRGRLGTNCQSWLGLHLQLLEQAAVIVVWLP